MNVKNQAKTNLIKNGNRGSGIASANERNQRNAGSGITIRSSNSDNKGNISGNSNNNNPTNKDVSIFNNNNQTSINALTTPANQANTNTLSTPVNQTNNNNGFWNKLNPQMPGNVQGASFGGGIIPAFKKVGGAMSSLWDRISGKSSGNNPNADATAALAKNPPVAPAEYKNMTKDYGNVTNDNGVRKTTFGDGAQVMTSDPNNVSAYQIQKGNTPVTVVENKNNNSRPEDGAVVKAMDPKNVVEGYGQNIGVYSNGGTVKLNGDGGGVMDRGGGTVFVNGNQTKVNDEMPMLHRTYHSNMVNVAGYNNTVYNVDSPSLSHQVGTGNKFLQERGGELIDESDV